MYRSRRPSFLISLALAASIIVNLSYLGTKFGFTSPLSALSSASANNAETAKDWAAIVDASRQQAIDAEKAASTLKSSIANFPAEYLLDLHDASPERKWCESRYGPTYLETLAKNARPYCTPSSRSQFDCMHATMLGESRKDSFCLARNLAWDNNKFHVDCELRDWAEPDLDGIPRVSDFVSYWYSTGPKNVMRQWITMGSEATSWYDKNVCGDPATPRDDGYKILIKREGGGNYWHTLMEIISYYFSIDALQMAINPKTGQPYMSAEDVSKIQVLILDNHKNKHYWDMWGYFSDNPIRHIKEWAAEKNTPHCIDNLILPLPGASNPFWQGDWEPRDCERSLLAETVRSRVLNRLQIPTARDFRSPLNVTFMTRKSASSRRLTNLDELTQKLTAAYPGINLNFIDMSKYTFREQLNIIVQTDVLVGVHGAGHTHAFFLPSQSSVVEILPEDFKHRGFRNLAALRGLRYFSDHAQIVNDGEKSSDDWQNKDVVFKDTDAFMKLIDAAIQSVAHRGLLDSDVS
ncbi:hypothetical protein ABW20_dc0107520 [Dactylellina cionopaga]|nr:hypothetical protein ABW20_dc0107520 [Dactylellina cionopaga]